MSNYEWIKHLKDDETAKPIKGFPGYFITDKGRVYSNHSGKFLKSCLMSKTKRRPNPYTHQIKLGHKVSTHIHTLVGRHFLSDYEEGLLILHKDETLPFPETHYVENLFCGTQKDNVKDKFEKGRHHIVTDSKGRFTFGG